MSSFLITDREHIKFHYDGWEVDGIHLNPIDSYSMVSSEYDLGMKSIGRIYFDGFENLDYASGEPVERAVISGGEKGALDRYLRAGASVYTGKQVKEIINSRIYENGDKLKPRLPEDVYDFLKEVAENKGRNKPQRARDFLDKYEEVRFDKVEGEE